LWQTGRFTKVSKYQNCSACRIHQLADELIFSESICERNFKNRHKTGLISSISQGGSAKVPKVRPGGV